MNSRQLALLTRQLIAACGGLDESACACRLKKSRLSQCQDPSTPGSLPVDVVNALELYCGEPVVSRHLVEDRPARLEPEDLAEEACGTAEVASDLQRQIRAAMRSQEMTPRRAKAIEAELMALVDHVRRTHAALLEREGAKP